MGKAMTPPARVSDVLRKPAIKSHAICARQTECVVPDLNQLYDNLKSVVPTISDKQNLSTLELMQHAIDYIYDLNSVLSENSDDQPKVRLPTTTEVC